MSVPDQQKTKRRARVNRMRRWDQIDDKMWNKWEKVFKEKFQNFKGSWTLAVTNDCPSTHEWEHSLEERISIACKCKDCNHVWVTDSGIVCFYYSFKQSNTGELAGKTLVWVKPQLCPNREKCGSSNLPLIDVYQDEVEAVLSYLMMEIGWYFYQINYTKDEENQIESQRKMREKKTKEKKNPQVKKGSPKLNDRIASLDQTPQLKGSVRGGLQIPKPNESQASPPVDIKRITKLKTRWDKSPEQIKQEWELSFQNKFEYFTKRYPTHKWTMSLEKVTKDHPLRREQKWERFLGEKVEAGFKCPLKECGYVWESKRAWISFWMWLDPPNSEGVCIGHVAVHILGQKCFNCRGNPNSKPYYTGDLQPEEIDAVLSFLLMEIDFHYYGNENYTDLHEEEIEKRRINSPMHYVGRAGHRKELCQSCQQKVCKKRVTAVYPNPVVPTE